MLHHQGLHAQAHSVHMHHSTRGMVASDENSPGAHNRGGRGYGYDASSNIMLNYVDSTVATPKTKHSTSRSGRREEGHSAAAQRSHRSSGGVGAGAVMLTPETSRGRGPATSTQSFGTPSNASTTPSDVDEPRAPLKEDRQQQPIVSSQPQTYFEKTRVKCLKFEDEQSLAPLGSTGGGRSKASKSGSMGASNKTVRIDPAATTAGGRESKLLGSSSHSSGETAASAEAMQTPKKASAPNDWIYGRQQSYTFDDMANSPVESIPLISGFNVLVNSPDPLSKYHDQSTDHSAEDVIDVSHTPYQDRGGGGAAGSTAAAAEEEYDYAARLGVGAVSKPKQSSEPAHIERFAVPKPLTVAEMRRLEFGSDPAYDARPPPQPRPGKSLLVAPSHLSPQDELIKSRNVAFRDNTGANSNISPDGINAFFNDTMSPLRPNYSNLKKMIHNSAAGTNKTLSMNHNGSELLKNRGEVTRVSKSSEVAESPKPGASRTPDRTSSKPARPRPGIRRKTPTSGEGSPEAVDGPKLVTSSLSSLDLPKSKLYDDNPYVDSRRPDVAEVSSLPNGNFQQKSCAVSNSITPTNLSKIIGDIDTDAASSGAKKSTSPSESVNLSQHFEAGSGCAEGAESPSKPVRPSYPPKGSNARSNILLRRRSYSSPVSKSLEKASPDRELHSSDDMCNSSGLLSFQHTHASPKRTPRVAEPDLPVRPCTSPASTKAKVAVVEEPRIVDMPRRKQHKAEREKYVPYLEILSEDQAVSYDAPSWLTILKGPKTAKSKRNEVNLSQTLKFVGADRSSSVTSNWSDSVLRKDFLASYGDGDSNSPFFGFECIFNRDGPGLKSFVESHENINSVVDACENTILMAAVLVGWERAARFLIKRGVDINAVNKFGRSALSYAIGMEYFDIRDFLLRKGATLG